MDRELMVGDIVVIKTGGPEMTAGTVFMEEDGVYVECIWYDGKRFRRENFPVATLKKTHLESERRIAGG